MEEKDALEAVKRIEKELAGMTHSPDIVRQLGEDFGTLKKVLLAAQLRPEVDAMYEAAAEASKGQLAEDFKTLTAAEASKTFAKAAKGKAAE